MIDVCSRILESELNSIRSMCTNADEAQELIRAHTSHRYLQMHSVSTFQINRQQHGSTSAAHGTSTSAPPASLPSANPPNNNNNNNNNDNAWNNLIHPGVDIGVGSSPNTAVNFSVSVGSGSAPPATDNDNDDPVNIVDPDEEDDQDMYNVD